MPQARHRAEGQSQANHTARTGSTVSVLSYVAPDRFGSRLEHSKSANACGGTDGVSESVFLSFHDSQRSVILFEDSRAH